MRVLFIKDRDDTGPACLVTLKRDPEIEIEEVPSLGRGIERLESGEPLDLVVCDYQGRGEAFLECILQLCPSVVMIVLTDDVVSLASLHRLDRNALFEVVGKSEAPSTLAGILEGVKTGALATEERSDDDLVMIPADNADFSEPLNADVYVRLGPGRFCRRFSAQKAVSSEEIRRSFVTQGNRALYVPIEQSTIFLDQQLHKLNQVEREAPTNDAARAAAMESLEVIHTVVQKAGFTSQIQEIAKKSASLTMSAVVANPKLTDIIARLDRQRGKYITSHSVMLAELACAIAYRIGWKTPAGLLKLSLAALLHDLSLSDNRLAVYREVPPEGRLSPRGIKEIRLHPSKAAEYARRFDDIPKDVDVILEQHHEQPDGTGFPRGLHHSKLSPYTCLFIIAHDLLHFLLENVPTSDRETMITAFLERNSERYSEGSFQKIAAAIHSGEAVAL